MEALSLEYNSITNRKFLFLFILFEIGAIFISFLFSYKIAILLPLAFVFLIVILLDAKVSLMILIALSTFVSYKNTTTLAFGMGVLIFVLAAMFLSIYLRFCIKGLKMMKGKLHLPLVTFILIVLLNAARGLFCSYKITYWGLETFAYLSFGLVFLIITFFESSDDIKRFFNILILLAIFQSIYGVVNYFLVGHRIGGTIFGIMPSMIAIVLLNLVFYSRDKRKRFLYLLFSFLPILHLLFSFTRGMWIGFLGALAFSYAFYVSQLSHARGRKFFLFIRGGMIALVVSFSGLLIFSPFLPGEGLVGGVLNRFRSGFSLRFSGETVSNYQRVLEYQAAIEKIKEKPVWGYGVGYGFDFRDWLSQKVYTVRAVHQDYLAIVLKMGLIGLLAFLWLFYVFFRNGLKIVRELDDEYLKGLSAGFLAVVLQLLLIGFTNHVFIGVMGTFYLAFAIGSVLVIERGVRITGRKANALVGSGNQV